MRPTSTLLSTCVPLPGRRPLGLYLRFWTARTFARIESMWKGYARAARELGAREGSQVGSISSS